LVSRMAAFGQAADSRLPCGTRRSAFAVSSRIA
jgi:hypothetical protein